MIASVQHLQSNDEAVTLILSYPFVAEKIILQFSSEDILLMRQAVLMCFCY